MPWITLEHNGLIAFGAVDRQKRHLARAHRPCQICGQQLGDRIYLLVRPMDLRAGYVSESAVYPRGCVVGWKRVRTERELGRDDVSVSSASYEARLGKVIASDLAVVAVNFIAHLLSLVP
ncbi:hypothetical protein [Streptomyces sp. NPDC004270]